MVGLACQPPVGAPVHPLGLIGERLGEGGAAAQPFPDPLRFQQGASVGCFVLALVGKIIAVTAGEQFAPGVKLRHAAATINIVRVYGADEPRTLSTEMTGCP